MSAIEKALLQAMTTEPVEGDGVVTASYRLARNFPAFEGHFPDNPVCPAVVQARAALLALEQATGRCYRLEGIGNAKFVSPLGPEEPFTATLTPRADGRSFDVVLSEGETLYSKLRMTLISVVSEGSSDE